MHLTLTLFLLFSILSSFACAEQKPFSSLEELHGAMSREEPDLFWSRVLAHKTMPLIFGETAIFLWRGNAEKVEWRSDFNAWDYAPDTVGKRVGNSNIWWFERSFPKDTRLDYKIVVNGKDWQTDSLNPHQQVGGFGPNSELRMPAWKPSDHVVLRKDIGHGTFTNDIAFDSKKLGYSINYRVYTPAGYTSTSQALPLLYVTDGSDYWRNEMGALIITLDNLIADKKISPIIAVFMDPWDRKAEVNRRESELVPTQDRVCNFCEFIVDELMPLIEQNYRVKKSRDARAIVGASLGGLHSTLMALRYGSLFGLIGVQSPSYNRAPWVLQEVGNAEPLPIKAFINAGTFEDHFLVQARQIRDIWHAKRVQLQYIEVNDGHSWGHWRALMDDLLIFFFPR